jgi:hypothetical protein
MDPQPARAAVEAVLRADRPSAPDALAALPLLSDLRADLDRAEQQLIGIAREQGASWREIAAALRLGSRQAAEQRWLRLAAAVRRDPADVRTRRRRQQIIDTFAGEEVRAVRDEAARLRDRLARRPGTGAAAAAIGLAERTLAAAADAPPGALYDLARLAVADLRPLPRRAVGRPAAEALAALRAALEHPARPSQP